MDIRVLRPSDIPHVQLANITNLPENYFCKYYLYHAMSWPQLSYVAVDVSFVVSLFRGGWGGKVSRLAKAVRVRRMRNHPI